MFDEEQKRNIVKTLCEEWAERYQQEHKRGPSAAELLLNSPQAGMNFVLRNGFARAGGEQAGYGDIAVQSLNDSIMVCNSYQKLMQLENASEIVWARFVQICAEKRIGNNQMINEGVVKGTVKLAQKSAHFNPFEQLGSTVVADTIGTFMLLRNIHGIGDKVASFIMRDIVTILDVENKIVVQNQILLQPIDRWIQGMAAFIWNDLGHRTPFWLTALRVVTKCREYGFSPARFNQGAWKYGSSTIVETQRIPKGITDLAHS